MSCSGPFFILNIETDVIPGDSAERCTSCQRRGSKTEDQDENLSKVCCCLFIFWLCKTSSHLTKNNTCLQSNINDCTFSAFFECLTSFGTKAKHCVHTFSCCRSLDVLLQGQRAEVESMVTDMGISQAAVEQLSIYCISLKK